ncbi:MAG: SUMF1/EgtB/PvdO family nonheme iron enzyme [Deltaproteobacteria bacterium]|nr:SUMF1/EgtB/PvdO family nonheme iron enzyme [Deltaproteobacteria bacterium]
MPLGHLEQDQLFAGDFRVVRQLGEGGMGAVYVVEQLSTGRQRALKLMLARIAANPKSRARFIQEAQIGARVASEHVVQVITAGVDDTTATPYLVMELLDGEDLATFVERTGPMSPGRVLHVFGEICHAVAAAHRAGIVHRDLKPQNVFLARSMRSDGAVVVKVLDFGIAKLLDDERGSRTTQAVGSPLWLAPEQAGIEDPILPCTDVWSLGLIAFWMLSGKMYWRAANKSGGPGAISVEQVLTEILVAPIEPPRPRAEDFGAFDKIPDWFSPWFLGTVARKQASRMVDAEAAFVALRQAAAAAGVRAEPIDPQLISTPSPMVARSLPAAGQTPPTSPERPGATADTDRDVRHPVDTAPARPGARPAPETGALRDVGAVRDVPTTRDALPVADASTSQPVASGTATGPSTAVGPAPAERSFRTAPLPVASGEISAPAVAVGSRAVGPVAPPAVVAATRRRSRAIPLVVFGVAAVAVLGGGGLVAAVGMMEAEDGPTETPSAIGQAPAPTASPVPTEVAAPPAGATPSPIGPATLTPAANGDEEAIELPSTAALIPTSSDAGVRQLPSSMVAFPGGTFRSGSTAEEAAAALSACLQEGDPEDCPSADFAREQPAQTVTVGPFAIDRAEVANRVFAQWLSSLAGRSIEVRTVDGETHPMVIVAGVPLAAVHRPGGDERIGIEEAAGGIAARSGFARQPVVAATWLAADRFCRWRRRTLPTDAQWELAAGAGARRYVVSDAPPPCAAVVRGRYDHGPCASEPRMPRPVRSTDGDVTPEGVHDLGGNVGEWVAGDVAPVAGDECGGASQPACRIVRGGYWDGLLDRVRARARSVAPEDAAYTSVGFRCAQTL